MSKPKTRKIWLFAGLLVCALFLASARQAFGQATAGTISGTVVDQQGGSVPRAAVTVKNLETNAARSVTTEEDGRFLFAGLPVGRYEVTIERSGFAKYVRGPIVLLLNQVAVVNAELKAATVTETVVVTEAAPLLNTTSAEVGVRVDEKRISELPISGQFGGGGGFRDIFSLALGAPGVSQTNSGNSTFTTGTNFSVNGMRLRGNNFMIDGQDSNDPSITGRQQLINNPDIVQEFRLITNQFTAEYGRAAGAVVNVVTKSGTNAYHGSAFWFYNSNALNSLSNLNKAAGFTRAPFINEHQFGGTFGGPIRKDHTFFFGSFQRWTIRQLGSGGASITGAPTDAGRQLLQQLAGNRPQVQALLKHLPAAQTATGATVPLTVGGTTAQIPVGTLTNSVGSAFSDYQGSARVDHNFNNKHSLGARFLYEDGPTTGSGQTTPPNLTSDNLARRMAQTVNLTSNFTPRLLNEVRLSWQRLASNTLAPNPVAQEIPSIEITELGLTGFNAASSRTAIGLAVNLPQFRRNDTYQLQETVAWTRGAHAVKFGIDFRRVNATSFFFPTIRGLLRYSTLQRFVDDIADAANINKPLPGGETINHYKWYDYYAFVQDTWQVHPTLSLSLGLRYETPGNAIASLFPVSDNIVKINGNNPVFSLTPRPERDMNNFQPRVGFSWNPHTGNTGLLGKFTGGNRLVVRGGYARTNDYQFINIALNIASAFPFVAAINNTNLAGAFTVLPTLQPSFGANSPDCGANPNGPNCLTRTIVQKDFRAPLAEQFSLEIQRELPSSMVFRVGYVGTKGTALFQTQDGNPRTLCNPIPTTSSGTVIGCPRQDITQGVIRRRANSASSIYHSLQVSLDRRFNRGLGIGAHYTWSAFIDTASEVFNPSARGEVAIAQNIFDPRNDRGRSTYDRPHRFSMNAVYELPFYRSQSGALGHIVGGWQVGAFLTFQSGTPFTPLNGSDPTAAEGGIDGLVGNAIRPNLNTTLNVSDMTLPELLAAGGRTLFSTLPACQRITGTNTCTPIQRFGNAGRNILRADGIGNLDFNIQKSTRITETHQLQFRADFFNMTNTLNFGIPEARVNNAGFGQESTTDGGNRRIFMSLRYVF